MRVIILKSFPFSRDGFTPLRAIADTVEDIPDALIAGLRAAGFVGAEATDRLQIGDPQLPAAAIEDRDDVPQRDRRRRGK